MMDVVMTDYHQNFDINVYLNEHYRVFDNEDSPVVRAFRLLLGFKHNFWATIEPLPLKSVALTLLEYGGGASMGNLISAAPKVGRIVFSEYTEVNRDAANSWLIGDLNAFDWSSCTDFVARKLEGDSNPQSVQLRMEELKQKIKSVVPCDINKEPIVDLEQDDLKNCFDVVSTSLCLSACTTTAKEYKNAVTKLCKLVKPGGRLYMSDVLNGSFYMVGQHKFFNFDIGEKLAKEAMEDAGLVDLYFEKSKFALQGVDRLRFDATDVFAVYGRKSE